MLEKVGNSNGKSNLASSASRDLTSLEVLEKVAVEHSIHFNFPKPEKIPPPVLKIEDGVFGYSPEKILYENI